MTTSSGTQARPFLSIVTISFKDSSGLKKTLKSLDPLRLYGLSWEHVIIDSSPEENRGVLQGLPSDWPLVHQPETPEGIYRALNSGVKAAHGEVVWLLNGGDRLHDPDVLMRSLSYFEADPSMDLLCAGVAVYRDKTYLRPRRPRKSFLRNVLGSNHLCQQAVLYRRKSMLRVGEFDERFKVAADYHHMIRCYMSGLKARFTKDLLVDFDLGGASSNVEMALADFAMVHRELSTLYPFPLDHVDRTLAVVERMRVRIIQLTQNTRSGEKMRGLWHFLQRFR